MTKFEQVAKLLGTNDKKVIITYCLAALIEAGVAVDVAIDMVCGEGSYKRLAGEIWEAARAKAGIAA